MQIKSMLVILLLSSLIFLISSCATLFSPSKPIVGLKNCPPTGYVLVKEDALTDLLESCLRTKSELNECLEREREIGR